MDKAQKHNSFNNSTIDLL